MLVAEELFERGDPGFVDELRKVADADRLGAFAAKWFADKRPVARDFLADYLSRPLNAFRHEALVKRLFKLAEKAGDDQVMAWFLAAFDRSVRRIKKRRVVRTERRSLDDRETAQALVRSWDAEGAANSSMHDYGGRYAVWAYWNTRPPRWEQQYVDTEFNAKALAAKWKREGSGQPTIQDMGGRFSLSATWYGERIRVPSGTAMPRGKKVGETTDWRTKKKYDVTDLHRALHHWGPEPVNPAKLSKDELEKLGKRRLFSVHTRHYLRRRAWRYFRELGKRSPERYVRATAIGLKSYTDQDVADGLALLDNWGLVHILFHASPVLVSKASGWTMAPNRALAELAPAPIFPELWNAAPRTLIDLLKEAKSRPVRQWATRMLRNNEEILAHLPLEEMLELLRQDDEDVVALISELLTKCAGYEGVTLERWLALLDAPTATAIETVCELMALHLKPEQVSFELTVRFAMARPLPVARLGFQWLQSRTPADESECRELLRLADAEAEPLRPTLVRWACEALGASPFFQTEWVVEILDSRHDDVRAEGWKWLQAEPRAAGDVAVWRKLLESPYDDVQLKLVAELESREHDAKKAGESLPLDADLVRSLWASVLLNIHRGGRTKPVVVGQMARRLERRPDEAPALLPILAAALRSVRGPEWQAGLAGVVQAVERDSSLAPLVAKAFPELHLTDAVTG
jgi:hypothetical protein